MKKETKRMISSLTCLGRYTSMFPFIEMLVHMPKYTKFLKDLISNKKRMEEFETVTVSKKCSALITNKLAFKCRHLRSLTITCTIGSLKFQKALCDLGTSISLMPLLIFKKLGLEAIKQICICNWLIFQPISQ